MYKLLQKAHENCKRKSGFFFGTETLANFFSWSQRVLNSNLLKAQSESDKQKLIQYRLSAIDSLKEKMENSDFWPKGFKLKLPSDPQQDSAKTS